MKDIPHKILTDLDELSTVLDSCVKSQLFCCDFETNTINPFDEDALATILGFTNREDLIYILPIYNVEGTVSEEFVKKSFDLIASKILSNPNVRVIAHNLQYELHFFRLCMNNYDFDFRCELHDTMVMSHFMNENRRHGLKGLVNTFIKSYSGYESELSQYMTEKNDYYNIELAHLARYCAIDVYVTLKLFVMFEKRLKGDDEHQRLWECYSKIKMPALLALNEATSKGMHIDLELLESSIEKVTKIQEQKYDAMLSSNVLQEFQFAKRKEAYDDRVSLCRAKMKDYKEQGKMAFYKRWSENLDKANNKPSEEWYSINLNSPAQMKELIYTHKKGFKYSSLGLNSEATDSFQLMEIYRMFPDNNFLVNLLAYRTVSKILNTYLIGIRDRLDGDKIHGRFNINGTKTGRISSSDPNLQNLISRSSIDDEDVQDTIKIVKKLFIAPQGYDFIQIDYATMELRIAAAFADEHNMIKAFANGEDLHAKTAANVLEGVSVEEFNKYDKAKRKKIRFKAKGVNFGFIYNMGAESFKDYVKNMTGQSVTSQEAVDIRDKFFETYPNLTKWYTKSRAFVTKYGFVRTFFGTKRRVGYLFNTNEKYKIKSLSVNAPVQGTSGLWTLAAIAEIYKEFKNNDSVVIANTIHDSVIFYVKRDQDYNKNLLRIREIMEWPSVVEEYPAVKTYKENLRKIGLKVDLEVSSKSWGDLKEIDFPS